MCFTTQRLMNNHHKTYKQSLILKKATDQNKIQEDVNFYSNRIVCANSVIFSCAMYASKN